MLAPPRAYLETPGNQAMAPHLRRAKTIQRRCVLLQLLHCCRGAHLRQRHEKACARSSGAQGEKNKEVKMFLQQQRHMACRWEQRSPCHFAKSWMCLVASSVAKAQTSFCCDPLAQSGAGEEQVVDSAPSRESGFTRARSNNTAWRMLSFCGQPILPTS